MKKTIILLLAIFLLLPLWCCSVPAQTNNPGISPSTFNSQPSTSFYPAGEIDVAAAPTFFFPGENKANPLYGYSIEVTYWQTLHTGTGLEFGDYHFQRGIVAILDYTSANEYWRVVPFPQNPFWCRLELETFTGVETWYDDGSKGAKIGGGFQFAFNRNAGLQFDFTQHFDTTAVKNGEGCRLCLTVKF